MIIRKEASGLVRVIEPEVLDRLRVELVEGQDADIGSLGFLDDDGEHVWLDVEELRDAAGRGDVPATWEKEFDDMVQYAASQGWLYAGKNAIRAHIERE